MRVAGWVWVGFTKETVVKGPTTRDSMETASYVIGRTAGNISLYAQP